MVRLCHFPRATLVLLSSFVLAALCAHHDGAGALSIPPSQYWDGIDGPWSTFGMQVGSPNQQVRVLPATGLDTTWVVHPLGCTSRDPDNCGESRGGLFQSGRSNTWNEIGLYELSIYEEAKLGLSGNGTYGTETVTLGWPGNNLPSVKNQVVAGIATKDFYMGAFPLSPWSINFTTLDNSRASLMTSLKNQSKIPSLTWGYTAGSYNYNPPIFGSLTLGGYDERRFEPNNLNFSMGADISREFLVAIQSIYTNISTSALLSTPIFANIDSLVAQMWLPQDVCAAFERAFGITYNSASDLYLVNATQHARLLDRNPEVTLNIGSSANGNAVTINMPYSSFMLNASRPLLSGLQSSPSRYFPLKRADNSSQYTLGRVFLQNAYLTANYEYFNFSVAQARYPTGNAGQKLIRLCPKGGCDGSSSSGLSTGAIVGIVIGVLAILAITGLAVWWFVLRPRRRERQEKGEYALTSTSSSKHHPDAAEAGDDERYQLDGREKQHAELGDTAFYEAGQVPKPTPQEIGGTPIVVHEMPAPNMVAELGTGTHSSTATATAMNSTARNSPYTTLSNQPTHDNFQVGQRGGQFREGL